MVSPSSADRFVYALAAAIVPSGTPGVSARQAREALDSVLEAQSSLILDVQFTGFTQHGNRIGGLQPEVLRAAAQLIMLRVARLGFTSAASAEDLEKLFGTLARPASALRGGIVAELQDVRPRGVYVSTSTEEVYRPAADAAPRTPDAQAVGAPPADAAVAVPVVDDLETDFADFQLLDALPALAAPEPVVPPRSPGPVQPANGAGDPPEDDTLFQFFRTSATGGHQGSTDELIRSLREADNLARFTDLARTVGREIGTRLEKGRPGDAVDLVYALSREADREDRSRNFREAVLQQLQVIPSEGTLQHLIALLEARADVRDRVLPLFPLLGDAALSALETLLFRTGDATLRTSIFRSLVARPEIAKRLLDRTLADAQLSRTRAVLNLAGLPDLERATAQRWVETAAKHADPGVRADAAKNAAKLPGRDGVRVLVDLLNNGESAVQRAALQALGSLADPVVVPFLARVLGDTSDEDLQMEVLSALGQIATTDILPPLANVLNRRQFFGSKRLTRLKLAALEAASRVPGRAGRDFLAGAATSKDAEVAEAAARLIAALTVRGGADA